MPLALKLLAPPTQEPLSLEEAKRHLRVDSSDENTLILGYIAAARDYAERFTGRQFLTATWALGLGTWPCATGWRSTQGGLWLPRPPLQTLTGTYVDLAGDPQPLGITYVDSDGATQTLATTVYGVDTLTEPGRVYLKSGQSWPNLYDQPYAVQVTYKAGWLTVPQLYHRHASLRSALLLLVGHLYENREASAEKTLSEIPLGVESLLWMNRLLEVA